MRKIKNDTVEIIRKAGLKATPARLLILKLFIESSFPLSAELIHKKTSKTDSATVYRTLSIFLSKNLIQKIELGGNASVYELKGKHHHHIVCQKCGLVEDFTECHIDKLQNAIMRSSKHFNKIKEHSFELFGLCQKCEK